VTVSSIFTAGVLGFVYNKLKKSKEIKKVHILDLAGSTPLVYLPKLSKAVGS